MWWPSARHREAGRSRCKAGGAPAAAKASGVFDDEIVPCKTTMAEKNKETGEVTYREVVATMDNCNRPSTTLEGLAS